MGRPIVAVVTGAVVWAALWLGFNAVLPWVLPDVVIPGERLEHTPALAVLILYSVALSALAGFTTAAVAKTGPMRAVWALAALQLVLGIVAEASAWDLLPVWYHLVFLALLVPATLAGGWLRTRGRSA